MKEKILAKLQTKFQGVDAATLSRIAEKKAVGLTDGNMIDSIVEGVSFQDVLTNYGDFRANGASSTAIENYEKKHKLKDGKVIEEPKNEPNPPKPQEEDMPAWAKAIIQSNTAMAEKLTALEGQRKADERKSQVIAKAKEYGINEALVSMLNIPEDADIDTFMRDAKQIFVNQGMSGTTPPEGGAPPKDGLKSFAEAISKLPLPQQQQS